MPTVLAADVGGTKTQLGLFDAGSATPVATRRLATGDFDNFGSLVATFLDGRTTPVDAACIAVAGPVTGRRVKLTNVPWTVDADELAARFHLRAVRLANDVAATARAIPLLETSQLETLHAGAPDPDGPRALIAPGTGLSEATRHRSAGTWTAYGSEAGHADFAARTPREIALLTRLSSELGRVSYEHVLSGPGLTRLHAFVHDGRRCEPVDAVPPAERPAAIARRGLSGDCPRCIETLELFVSALGAEAGNLGLRAVATGGVYLGGGIPRRLLAALRRPAFLDAFTDKAPMRALVERMPVSVITEPAAALTGAAALACELLP